MVSCPMTPSWSPSSASLVVRKSWTSRKPDRRAAIAISMLVQGIVLATLSRKILR
jgi:hypothetical protein